MLITFYFLAVAAVIFALGVLVFRSPVYCALSLVGCFLILGVIFILLNSEFLGAVQILIYAGAIMVLFLFVIMLLNLRAEDGKLLSFGVSQLVVVALTLGGLAQLVAVFTHPGLILGSKSSFSAEYLKENGAIETVGQLLLEHYALPFEVIAILLMVAIIGAILLAKHRPELKTEDPE